MHVTVPTEDMVNELVESKHVESSRIRPLLSLMYCSHVFGQLIRASGSKHFSLGNLFATHEHVFSFPFNGLIDIN